MIFWLPHTDFSQYPEICDHCDLWSWENRPGILGGYTLCGWGCLIVLGGKQPQSLCSKSASHASLHRLRNWGTACDFDITMPRSSIMAFSLKRGPGQNLSRPLFSARSRRSCPSFVKHSHLFADPMSCGHLFQETGDPGWLEGEEFNNWHGARWKWWGCDMDMEWMTSKWGPYHDGENTTNSPNSEKSWKGNVATEKKDAHPDLV